MKRIISACIALILIACAALCFEPIARAATDGYGSFRLAFQSAGGVYTTTSPVLANLEHNELHLDSSGHLQVSVEGPASISSTAAITSTLAPATVLAASAGRRLMGVGVREIKSSAAVATISLYSGTSSSASTVLVEVELAADTEKFYSFGPAGVDISNGLTFQLLAGEVRMTLHYR